MVQEGFQKITIKGQLTTLNDMVNANRTNKYLGAKIKKEMTELVTLQLGRMRGVKKPCTMAFHWYISSNHDPDNVRSACKFILDGMMAARKLPNDNQKWILGFTGDFFVRVDKGKEKVIVEIQEY